MLDLVGWLAEGTTQWNIRIVGTEACLPLVSFRILGCQVCLVPQFCNQKAAKSLNAVMLTVLLTVLGR
jgi:hypothetical protein